MLTLAASLLVGALAVPAACAADPPGGAGAAGQPDHRRGWSADRFLTSDVPGPVGNAEIVRVGLGGDGSVRTVTADQRLELMGEGDYAVRERGPARSAVSLSQEPPPVTRRGAVAALIWRRS